MIPALLMVSLMTFPIEEINAVNKECYDHQADRWLRFPFSDFLPDWVKRYSDPKQGVRALDIGSGNGVFAKWLQEEGFNILCIDPSDEMCRRSRAKGLKTIQTTLQEFQEKETFDSIFAICSLLHIPKADWPAQIDKIACLLNGGGTFFLALREGATEGYEEQQTGYPRFFSNFEEKEVLNYLEQRFDLLDFRRSMGQADYLIFALRKKP
jgi:2-polyprenyl-3-methyl-5-hydroxy-6-metoxy-1,4-benzoquinol methylase